MSVPDFSSSSCRFSHFHRMVNHTVRPAPDIQSFAGSLEGQRARKGVFIATTAFSSNAQQYVSRIERRFLIDGTIAELCVDFGIGVSDRPQFKFRKLDESFFETD